MLLRPPSNFNERKTIMGAEMNLQVKKEWKTPELIVLVRSKPEEAVLASCKYVGGTGSNNNANCKIGGAAQCNAIGTS